MALGLGEDCLEREQSYVTGYGLCGYEDKTESFVGFLIVELDAHICIS